MAPTMHMEDHSSHDQTTCSSTDNVSLNERSMVGSSVHRRTDPAWEHFSFKKEGRSKVYTCRYCSNVYRGGGINRLKHHLAGTKGEITPCKKVPHDVRCKMKETLEEASKKNKLDVIHEHNGNEEGCAVANAGSSVADTRMVTADILGKRKALEGCSKSFVGRTTHSTQLSLKSAFKNAEAHDNFKMCIARWAIANASCIPFSALQCPLFQKFIDSIAALGAGSKASTAFKVPTAYDLTVNLLPKLRKECQLLIEAHRCIWETNGCTLIVEGWNDAEQHTLINFLVYSTEGIVFVKPVDASELLEDTKALFMLFCEVIEWIGPKNIVHVVVDNSADYATCGKSIHDKYKHIYWSPCAAHCLDLILKDIASMPHVSDLVSKASKITLFVYNYALILSWLRNREDWGEIVLPGATEFSTTFLTLRRIYEHKHDLQALVVDKHFADSKLSKTAAGKVFHAILLDNKFWNDCYDIVMLVNPLMQLLRIIEGDEKPSLGFVYGGMLRAKTSIKKRFNENKEKYKPYIDIIEARWDEHLKTDLHAVACYLNPIFIYDEEFSDNDKGKVMESLLNLLEAVHPDNQVEIMNQLSLYRNRNGCFAQAPYGKAARGLPPHEWWTDFGGDVPELQRLAVHILSQTSSSYGCEQNRKLFERLHRKRRNDELHERLNDLAFTSYNLRLQHRSQLKERTFDPIDSEYIDKVDFWVAIDDDDPEYDDGDCNSLMSEENVPMPPPPPDRDYEGDEDMNIPKPPPLFENVGLGVQPSPHVAACPDFPNLAAKGSPSKTVYE